MSLKIMFHGPAGCGKDTAADYLIAKYGGVKVKFARKVYEIAHMIQNELGLENYKDRKLLQFIGHDYGRETINKSLWINYAKEDIKKAGDQNIFITDNRYLNEIEELPDFISIKIIRNVEQMTHDSENQQIPNKYFAYKIENDSDLDDFYTKLDYVIGQLKQ